MGTGRISKIYFVEEFQKREIALFSTSDVKKVFHFESENTLKHLMRRLARKGIIQRLAKGKYLFIQSRKEVSDFAIANFLVYPSYVSLESALTFHGLLDQFPYEITSLTTKKPKRVKARGKIFSYSQIKPEFFKEFIKEGDFVIASREKAVFDYSYFVYKNQRPVARLKELQSTLREKEMKKFFLENAGQKFLSFLAKHVEL